MTRPFMTSGAYEIVAGILRTAPVDDATRLKIADHFCREFNKRSPSFDPYAWERRTGGVLKRAETSNDTEVAQ